MSHAEATILEVAPDELDQLDLIHRALVVLNREYYGHPWQAGMQAGTLFIRLASIHGPVGFRVMPDQYLTDPQLKCVMRAGGELLERHGLSRTRRTESTYDPAKIGYLPAAPFDS